MYCTRFAAVLSFLGWLRVGLFLCRLLKRVGCWFLLGFVFLAWGHVAVAWSGGFVSGFEVG
jgi:hypothetical protein